MSIPSLFATSTFDPFITAYIDSDLIGRVIYLALLSLSFISWTILFYKWRIIYKTKEESARFKKIFTDQKENPLSITYQKSSTAGIPSAFFILYSVIKNKIVELLRKEGKEEPIYEIQHPFLLYNDFPMIEVQASISIGAITKYLEKQLYILSTIVTLAPFLGLLGTVYGILVTFSGMGPNDPGGGSTQHILGGLSLALSTTVVGLLNAIPALIGYNMLKNNIVEFEHEMERFSIEVLSAFDSHYRKRG